MVPTEYSGSANIFFVLHQRIPIVRREYNNLSAKIEEMRTHSPISPLNAWLVLMGDAPLALGWPWQGTSLIRNDPKCGLVTALRTVQDLLKRNPAGKSMVIIWAMDGLGGDWQGPVGDLAKLPGVSVAVMAYQANYPEDGAFLRTVRSCRYFEHISNNFMECVNQVLGDYRKSGTPAAAPAAAAPAPVQNAPAVPVKAEAAPAAAPLPASFQSMDTVHAPPPPAAGNQPVMSAAEPAPPPQPEPEPVETQPTPPPEAAPPAEVATEYPDLSNGKLDEMLGQRSEPKTETQTLPAVEPAVKPDSKQPPAEPQIVIDVAGKQANPVKLEKSPEPEPKSKPRPENKPEPEPVPAPAQPVKETPANLWAELDPPAELVDRFDPVAKKKFKTPDGWLMVAASRRGKMHAHKALFREDAFALGEAAGWHFMVVADGGGSRPLARVGSNLAAEVAVNAMCEFGRKVEISELTPEETCHYLLETGLRKAYEALQLEAGKRSVKLDDFGTTFLALVHRWLPGQKKHIVGVLQVGDGIIAAQLANKPPQVLGNADVGESASQTLFLTSRPWKDWLDRIQMIELEAEPLMFAAMCDGVSDDLIPYPRNLPRFFEFMQDIVLKEPAEDGLLEFLKYEMRGSFDDRTIGLLFRDAQKERSLMMRRHAAEFGEGSPTSSPADLPEAAEKHLD